MNASYAVFDDLKAIEIFNYIPELYPPAYFRDKWPKPILNLRDKLFVDARAVTEHEYQLLRQIGSEFDGEECQLALTVHLLSLRDRYVDTDTLLKRAVTASFRLGQLQSFVRVDHEYTVGPGSSTVYNYSPAGHGVTSSTAPELRVYSALTYTMCESLMIRQDEKLKKMTEVGIVDTIYSMCTMQRRQPS